MLLLPEYEAEAGPGQMREIAILTIGALSNISFHVGAPVHKPHGLIKQSKLLVPGPQRHAHGAAVAVGVGKQRADTFLNHRRAIIQISAANCKAGSNPLFYAGSDMERIAEIKFQLFFCRGVDISFGVFRLAEIERHAAEPAIVLEMK